MKTYKMNDKLILDRLLVFDKYDSDYSRSVIKLDTSNGGSIVKGVVTYIRYCIEHDFNQDQWAAY